jgi:hypothetical protein
MGFMHLGYESELYTNLGFYNLLYNTASTYTSPNICNLSIDHYI